MSKKKRILKWVGISLGLILFVGYFAFSTFLFKPFEADWEYDVSGLIPRQVDFFVAKAQLNEDFGEFPRLAIADELEANSSWQMFTRSPEYADFMRENEVEQTLADLRLQLDQLPFGLKVLDLFGGKDLAIAGNFKPGGLANSDWAVYGRTGFAGKAAVSMLKYPGVLGLDAQGLVVEELEDATKLTGGQLERPMYVTRVRDVIIAGTSLELVQGAPALERAGGEDSLYLSAGYADHVDLEDREAGNPEAEVIVKLRSMLESLEVTGSWPDVDTDLFAPSFLGRLIQAPSIKNIAGILGFPGGLRIDLHGQFSSERISDFQNRVYRTDGFDNAELMREAARLAPADCALFVYLHGPVTDILKEALASAEPALRSNLDDAIRSTGEYESIDALISELGDALRPRIALIVREQDYGPVTETIQATGEVVQAEAAPGTVFAVTMVTWMASGERSEQTLNQIRDAIGNNPDKFGLQGYDPSKPNDRGYYEFESEGFDTREYWSPFIPGTGLISTMVTDQNHFWMTNHPKMFTTMRRTFYQGQSRGFARLSELPLFRSLVDSGLDSSNLVVWFNPKKAGPTLREMAREWAEENVLNNVDYGTLRRQEEANILRAEFQGRAKAELSQPENDRLESIVDNAIIDWREEFRDQQAPALAADRQRRVDFMESAEAMLFMLDLDPSEFSLAARIVVPLKDR